MVWSRRTERTENGTRIMFVFDVETLGKESNSVILSMAAIYFNPDEQPGHQKLFDEAFFVKFDVADQMKRLGRKVGKSTMQWWAKQCENVRIKSFKPNPAIDVKFEDGYEAMRQWAKSKDDTKCYVWARGNLDQLVLDSFEEQLSIEPIWDYSRWRDVRTAVDFLYNVNTGYVKAEVPPWIETFDKDLHITKHNPIDDCVLDAMMLMYGKPNEQ
jgi:hypothetical protein